MHGLRVRIFADLESLHAVEERAGRVLAVGIAKSASGPAEPDVFHSLQLVTQAWQPTQTLRSMTSASCVISTRSSRPAEVGLPAPGVAVVPGIAGIAANCGEGRSGSPASAL